MKRILRKLFWPILRHFEKEGPAGKYKKSHRIILHIVGGLFLLLSLGSLYAVISTGILEALVPVVVFFSVGAVALIVGILGSENAVSLIWGGK